MLLFPAIDLIDAKAVRLKKGDYNQITVYSDNPLEVAKSFYKSGAKYLHVVDLQGAKSGETPNFDTIKSIIDESGLLVEVGGGIRNEQTVKKYIDAGVKRVILGTAAIKDKAFLEKMVETYHEKIAVGVDIKDGFVAIDGWTNVTNTSCFDFCEYLQKIGVKTVICTDISKDGMLGGTNTELYKELSEKFTIDFVASGGVTDINDIKVLNEMNMYGAILGKALYTKNIDLSQAVRILEGDTK